MNAEADKTETIENTGEWEELRARLLDDPEVREEYKRTSHSTITFREILQKVEAEREKAGLSKAHLAHRMGVNPASVRRLLTYEGSNPTLKTMLTVFDALELELSLKPAPRRKCTKRAVGTPPLISPSALPSGTA